LLAGPAGEPAARSEPGGRHDPDRAFWLARGAAAKLGVADRDDNEDDDVRSSAVFALSQQPKDVAVPRLIDLARHATHAGVRAQALFWLGQSNDTRAIDVFEEILGRR